MLQDLKVKTRKRLRHFLRNSKVFSPIRLDRFVEIAGSRDFFENYHTLRPAENDISLVPTENDQRFLQVSKYFRDGSYSRPEIYTCEVPDAVYHTGSGLVCTKEFAAIGDSQMTYRLPWCLPFNWFKPIRVEYLPGTFATINNTFWRFWWHWLVDCLPRIHCLQQAYPDERIVLLMPAEMGSTFKSSLESVLPENFEVKYMPSKSWVKVDRMLLPSYVSTRSNGHVPYEYYDFIRSRVFASFNLPDRHVQTERIYVSRAKAAYRRILNEKHLMELLSLFGFRSVKPETMSFREQVELFHKADMVVSAHGSNWGNILFSGKIKILVLYPDRTPNTHIFTMAKALGQDHHFLTGEEPSENSDFTVDLAAVRNVLENEMCLTPNT